MNLEKMPGLKIGELKADIPIIQGGMGVGISLIFQKPRDAMPSNTAAIKNNVA